MKMNVFLQLLIFHDLGSPVLRQHYLHAGAIWKKAQDGGTKEGDFCAVTYSVQGQS